MGKINRMTSETILHTAVAIYRAGLLMQCPSFGGIVRSKFFRIGVHAKMRPKKIAIVYPVMMNIVTNTLYRSQ